MKDEKHKNEDIEEISENVGTEGTNEPVEEPEVDNRTFGEKAEDLMDDVMGTAQDMLYGPRTGLNKDIPATIEKPNGIRKIDKVATRRNIRNFILGKKGSLIVLAIFVVALLIGLIVHFVG